MQPVTIIALLAFYALTAGLVYIVSGMWVSGSPLLWWFAASAVVALAIMLDVVLRRIAIGKREFLLSFGIALVATEVLYRWR